MVYQGHCSLCGQKLTDASGHWVIGFTDRGINKHPPHKLNICSSCHEELINRINVLSKERHAYMKERGITSTTHRL